MQSVGTDVCVPQFGQLCLYEHVYMDMLVCMHTYICISTINFCSPVTTVSFSSVFNNNLFNVVKVHIRTLNVYISSVGVWLGLGIVMCMQGKGKQGICVVLACILNMSECTITYIIH